MSLEWAHAPAAWRCIECPAEPCVRACPLGNDIPYALWHLEHGLVDDAARIFRRTSSMPASAGACAHRRSCAKESAPTRNRVARPSRSVASRRTPRTGWLARTCVQALPPADPPADALPIVGAGPAGITAAEALAGNGHAVTLFDAWPEAGGLLLYGIPRFKLSPEIVRRKTQHPAGSGSGVSSILSSATGSQSMGSWSRASTPILLSAIWSRHWATPRYPGLRPRGSVSSDPVSRAGQHGPGITSARAALPPEVGRRVAVIGGGDTAMDCVRTALRLGAEQATVWYRRTEAEMPGNPRDRKLAIEEGARIEWLVAPAVSKQMTEGESAPCGSYACSSERSTLQVAAGRFRSPDPSTRSR